MILAFWLGVACGIAWGEWVRSALASEVGADVQNAAHDELEGVPDGAFVRRSAVQSSSHQNGRKEA